MGEGVINYSLLSPRPHRGEGTGVRGSTSLVHNLVDKPFVDFIYHSDQLTNSPIRLPGSRARLRVLDRLPDAFRFQRHVEMPHTKGRQRIDHGIHNSRS